MDKQDHENCIQIKILHGNSKIPIHNCGLHPSETPILECTIMNFSNLLNTLKFTRLDYYITLHKLCKTVYF